MQIKLYYGTKIQKSQEDKLKFTMKILLAGLENDLISF